MQKHHEQIVQMLETKIHQAEQIAEGLKDEQEKKARENSLTHQDKKRARDLKFQIFDVCKLIYDQ